MLKKKQTKRNEGLRFNKAKMPTDVVCIINEMQKKINENKCSGFVSKEQVVYKLIRAFRQMD